MRPARFWRKRQHVATSEAFELDLLREFLAHLKVVFDLERFAQRHFHVLIFNLAVFHDFAVAPDLQIPLLWVDDDVEIFIRPVFLDDHVSEDFFQNRHQGLFVDVLEFLEFCKRFQQVQLHVDSDYGAYARGLLLNEMITFVQCTSANAKRVVFFNPRFGFAALDASLLTGLNHEMVLFHRCQQPLGPGPFNRHDRHFTPHVLDVLAMKFQRLVQPRREHVQRKILELAVQVKIQCVGSGPCRTQWTCFRRGRR